MSQLDELRQIIIGSDAEVLQELKDRIEDIDKRTKDVAEVLPDAIDERISVDGRLVDSLKGPVFTGLKEAIRSEPDTYAEILYPVMAPSIRRSISQALSSMLITINQTIESATTAQGLKYRLQSMRTGVPYAQLILRQTAPYKVEHVYLIDRKTSLLIDEMHSPDSVSLDGDAISAMFSAIQSFVQDSFSQDESSRLTDFKTEQQSENQNIWIVHGSHMMMACVILGDAPERVREKLYDTLDVIHVNYANDSANYQGDGSTFTGIEGYLEPIVALNSNSESDESEGGSSIVNAVLLALLCLALIVYGFYVFNRSTMLSTVSFYLEKTPGLAVTDTYWEDGKVVVEGLKDPDTIIPYAALQRKDIESNDIEFRTVPFRSLDYKMELQRFKQEFHLPEGLSFSQSDQKVALSGAAPYQWLQSNDLRIRQLDADGRLDIINLVVSRESIEQFLQSFFSAEDIKNIDFSIVLDARSKRNVAYLSGRLPSKDLNQLNLLFLNSKWVEIAVLSSN